MLSIFFFVFLRRPRSTLFPYTTLFRSGGRAGRAHGRRRPGRAGRGPRRRRRRGGGPGGRPAVGAAAQGARLARQDRKSTRLNSSHLVISYAVFCLKQKKQLL